MQSFDVQCRWGNSSIMIYRMMWMLRSLWLVITHDLFSRVPRYIDDVRRNLFSFCFVQHHARFWKSLRDYFGLRQVKALKKSLAGATVVLTKKKNGETETKRALDYLRMPKLQEIFTTVAIVCHRYERLAVLQIVFATILLWARKDVEKLFKETVYK